MQVTRIHKDAVIQMSDTQIFEQNQIRTQRGQKQLHRCSVCGHCGEWSNSWLWYGSLREADEGNILKFCGSQCREKHQTANLRLGLLNKQLRKVS